MVTWRLRAGNCILLAAALVTTAGRTWTAHRFARPRRCSARTPCHSSSVVSPSRAPLPAADEPIVVLIRGAPVDVTEYAKRHPGGAAILRRYHGKDATKAFEAVGHSEHALRQLQELQSAASPSPAQVATVARWRKLVTSEDPFYVHKILGFFVLVHFMFRYVLILVGGDRYGGFSAASTLDLPLVCVHGALSLTSLLFHVPRERVEGSPMIWSEFRAHNIVFALRSVAAFALAWTAARWPALGGSAVVASAAVVLAAQRAADESTARLRVDPGTSTTATMPYWPGAGAGTIWCFKRFYAYCQFCATCACLACANPSWPFAVLLPIQLASLLLTLVRKGLISARAYHLAYASSLCLPFLVGFRFPADRPFFCGLLLLAAALLALRRGGAPKAALWLPVCGARLALGYGPGA